MPHWSKYIVFSLLFTTADGMKKIPWVVACEDQEKQLPKVSSISLLVGLLQEDVAAEKGKEINGEFSQRRHRWSHTYMNTYVLMQKKMGCRVTSFTQVKQNNSGKCCAEHSFSVQMVSIQHYFIKNLQRS